MEWFYSIGWIDWLLSAAGVYIFGLPLLVLATFRHAADPILERIDPEQLALPPLLEQQYDAVQTELERDGFEAEGTLFLPKQMENVRLLFRLFVNRATQEAAMAASVFGLEQGRVARQTQYVEFCTRYVGGKEFNTGNSTEILPFGSHPDITTLHIPRITSVTELYRIHQAITSAKGPPEPKELCLDTKYDGDVAAYIAGGIQEELQRARVTGYLRLTPSSSYYRATWKGAYLMTWKQMPPFKYFAARHQRQKAENLLAEIGYR